MPLAASSSVLDDQENVPDDDQGVVDMNGLRTEGDNGLLYCGGSPPDREAEWTPELERTLCQKILRPVIMMFLDDAEFLDTMKVVVLTFFKNQNQARSMAVPLVVPEVSSSLVKGAACGDRVAKWTADEDRFLCQKVIRPLLMSFKDDPEFLTSVKIVVLKFIKYAKRVRIVDQSAI